MPEQKAHYVGNFAMEEDPNFHDCKFLWVVNTFREARGDGKIYVYKDIENKFWNVKIGLEFFVVNYCPWCGKQVFE